MFTAAIFTFCCILSLHGLAAQLLPRRSFLRVSAFLQLAVFSLGMGMFFLQPKGANPQTLVAAQGDGLLAWSPSWWFLGLFQQLNGSPALAPLARRACVALALAIAATAIAYALSWVRSPRRIIEEPDIVPVSRGSSWLPSFGGSLETAVVQFSIRTLLRSRQHRVILAFCLGIGFAVAMLYRQMPIAQEQLAAATAGWREVTVSLLASSVIILGFSIVGVRLAFSLPLELRANWLFRVSPLTAYLPAARRALYVVGVFPVWAGSAILFLSIWPWQAAVAHTLVLALVGAIAAELSLHSFQKIPFTCSYLPGKSNLHLTFWLSIGLIVSIIDRLVRLERRALEEPRSCVVMLAVLAATAFACRWRTSSAAADFQTAPRFEDEPPREIVPLELHRDGRLAV